MKNNDDEFLIKYNNLKNILDTMMVGVYVSDINSEIVYLNNYLQNEFGPVDNKKCYEYFYEHSSNCSWCNKPEVFKGNTVKRECHSSKNNKTYYIIDMPIYDNDGNISKLGIIRDITKYKKNELEISNLAKFPSENPNPVIRVSKEGRIMYSNNPGLFLLKNWDYKIGDNIQDDYKKNLLDNAFESGEKKSIEMKIDELFFLLELVPIKESGYINIYGYNITNKKQSEDALKQSEERYKLAQRAANIGTWDWDIITGKLEWSDRVEPMFGFEKNQFKKTYEAFLECIHPDDRQLVIDSVKACIDNKKEYDIEHRIIWPDGSIRWVSEIGDVIKDENGNAIRMLGVVQDITIRKEIEEFLRKEKENSEKLVIRKNKELLGAKRILDIKMKELIDAKRLSDIGKLAASVAHELRNPLGVIQAAIYNINKKNKDSSLEKHINNIEKKIYESEQIINNLLNYSRIKIPNYETINIMDILNDSIDSVQKSFKEYKVVFNKRIMSGKQINIEADQLQLKEVFNNILTNSYQAFQNKKGIISIEIKHDEKDSIKIIFSDNGIGIKKEDISKVFEPFFTLKSKGTGLGLSICNELINLHNGEINIESKVGSGTSVIIRLPVRKSSK